LLTTPNPLLIKEGAKAKSEKYEARNLFCMQACPLLLIGKVFGNWIDRRKE